MSLLSIGNGNLVMATIMRSDQACEISMQEAIRMRRYRITSSGLKCLRERAGLTMAVLCPDLWFKYWVYAIRVILFS
ncbi:hypothetical protein TNCT_54891 [Trichonephila clavata]|uniref:Uncharacterized protein n=1 Tax=Trichonephila clavata TaxID=2740835 RepID=A0A8X6HM28_TRICU|nr:hypothetical protein TNCT_54891 [Trichonephila clavata]